MSYTPTEWEPTDVVTATRMNALENAVGDMNMSYTPNTWSDGDILSAEKMNALEQAVASGGGGGSSEVSLATVTLTATAPEGYTVNWWSIGDASTPPLGDESASRYFMQENYSETSNAFPVILYQGVAYIGIFDFYDSIHEVSLGLEEPVLSDNVTFDSENYRYVVTGDCTIGGTLVVWED